MALIYSNTKLCDVINNEPSVIPVINRFGIYLGTGDSSIEAVCRNHGLDTEFFLTILNTFINESYFPEETLMSFSAHEIISYLIKTNNYYSKFQLPNIQRHFKLLLSSSDGNNNNLELMLRFFEGLKNDIVKRIDSDTAQWFPAIIAMENGQAPSAPLCLDDESTTIEDKLSDLKNMFIMHLSGQYDLNLCYGVIVAIITLEKDIRQNNRIRNRILLPISRSLLSQFDK